MLHLPRILEMVLHRVENAGRFQKAFGGMLACCKLSLSLAEAVLGLVNAMTFCCQALTIAFHKWT